jgi:hypothetical protein
MQEIAVFIIVAVAVAYLVRNWWMTSRGQKGCGGCEGACGSKTAKPNANMGTPLIQIQLNGQTLQAPKSQRLPHDDAPHLN